MPDVRPPAVIDRRRVFVSFASQEFAVAAAIAEAIDNSGVRSFFAPRDLHSGQNFALEIVRAITSCDIVVVLLSTASFSSPHVRREVSLAIDERRDLLPFAVSGASYPAGMTTEWNYWLSAVQVSEFVNARDVAQHVLNTLRPFAPETAHIESPNTPGPSTNAQPRRRTPLKQRKSPSALLRAELEALPLLGREEELVRLEEWSNRDRDFDGRLVTAGGGQGKTRLARELGKRLARTGWTIQVVTAEEMGHLVIEQLGEQPTLLVVDYAETRIAQLVDLVDGVLDLGLPNKLRLLMIARSASDWWKRLLTRSDVVEQMFEGMTIQPLRTLTADRGLVDELYGTACGAFSDELGIPRLSIITAPYRAYPSVLDVLEAALVHTLSNTSDAAATVTTRLLSHERRYIAAAAAADGIDGVDETDLDRTAAVLSLFGADNEKAAIRLVSYANADIPATSHRRLARLFRRLYPGTTTYIEGLKPDALAEDLIAQVVAEDGGIPNSRQLWEDAAASPMELRRALSTISGVAARHKIVEPELDQIIAAGTRDLLITAIEVATEIEDPAHLVKIIELAVERRPINEVRELFDAIPDETVNLAQLGAAVASRIMDCLPPTTDMTPEEIGLVLVCSNRFSDAGWRVKATESAQLAVARLEKLTESPGSLTHEVLGRALSNLSNRLWETGALSDALAPALKAVDELSQPEYNKLDLAAAQSNLGFRLMEAENLSSAFDRTREAENTFRAMAPQHRAAEAGLGAALNNLACICFGLERYEPAAAYGLEAVKLRRSQAVSNRDRYLPYVARTLANAAPSVMSIGRADLGIRMISEARALQTITGRRADIFQFEEAECALIHSVMLAINGNQKSAMSSLVQADALNRELGGALGELNSRLEIAIERNAAEIERMSSQAWSNVSTKYMEDNASKVLVLPTLLEYRDL